VSTNFDLLVIGAGPAGLVAAVQGRALGLTACVVDEQDAPGGQIYRAVERAETEGRAAKLGPDYRHGLELVRAFHASGADYLPNHQVWQVEEDGTAYVSDGDKSRTLKGVRVLVAVGAMERPVPIRGWTLPGVMTVGAAQILHKSIGVVTDESTWISGSGPLVLHFAAEIAAAGGKLAGILDTSASENRWPALAHWQGAWQGRADLVKGLGYFSALRRASIQRITGVQAVEARGDGQLASVRWQRNGQWHEAPATTLLLHEGVVPNTQMTRALDCAHDWDALQHCFRPRTDAFGASSVANIVVAGDCGGIGGARAAEAQGRIAAIAVACALGRIDAAERDRLCAPLRAELARHGAIRAFLDTLFPPRADLLTPPDDVIVCRCESLTAGDIRAAVKLGCPGPNQVKSFTRCGMGPCQGRLCGLTLTGIIAAERGLTPEAVGALRIRPPLKPLTVGELASITEQGAA
jgi:NADPH-dependent 2,4-dienoyl-CoA reductase/sulfur reductase-like enzyme